MGDIWVNLQYLPNNSFSCRNIKQRIVDIYMPTWCAHLNHSRHLAPYSKYEHAFEL